MDFSQRKIGDLSINDIYFKLNLYKKTELLWNSYNKSKEYDNYHIVIGYNVHYSDDIKTFIDFLTEEYVIYGKCPECNKPTAMTVYKNTLNDTELLKSTVWSYQTGLWDSDDYIDLSDMYMMQRIFKLCNDNGGFYNKIFQCPMCKNCYQTNFKLIFKDEKLILIKTGQYPSLRDFNVNYTNKLTKDLKRQNLDKEYNEGLITHDAGHSIAAYVYMRRVIEQIIMNKFNERLDKISDDEFKRKRFDAKIEYLKDDLPELLKDKKLYELTSAGIHMLSNDDCEIYFPILQQSIELILIEEDKKKKEAELKKSLSSTIEETTHKIKKQDNYKSN